MGFAFENKSVPFSLVINHGDVAANPMRLEDYVKVKIIGTGRRSNFQLQTAASANRIEVHVGTFHWIRRRKRLRLAAANIHELLLSAKSGPSRNRPKSSLSRQSECLGNQVRFSHQPEQPARRCAKCPKVRKPHGLHVHLLSQHAHRRVLREKNFQLVHTISGQ